MPAGPARKALPFIAAALFVYLLVLADGWLRARACFLKGESYLAAARSWKAPAAGAPYTGSENPAKYAAVWYRNASECFGRPANRWARMAAERLPEAERLLGGAPRGY